MGLLAVTIRAWLFKTNDVVSYGDVKILNVNISNMPIFFVETKNISVLGYKVL